jgi:hypothetical protein
VKKKGKKKEFTWWKKNSTIIIEPVSLLAFGIPILPPPLLFSLLDDV